MNSTKPTRPSFRELHGEDTATRKSRFLAYVSQHQLAGTDRVMIIHSTKRWRDRLVTVDVCLQQLDEKLTNDWLGA